MKETERIQDQLRRAFEGEAWHGPSIRALLAGIGAEQAAQRPLRDAHSIWEIVLHIAAWEDAVRRQLEGEVVRDLPPDQDWPAVRETGAPAWRETVAALERGHLRLRERVAAFPDERLAERVPAKDYSFYGTLHGVIQHDLYHGGQIAILKKAVVAAKT
jgi:uncharacterized damage-inducible protein DinB